MFMRLSPLVKKYAILPMVCQRHKSHNPVELKITPTIRIKDPSFLLAANFATTSRIWLSRGPLERPLCLKDDLNHKFPLDLKSPPFTRSWSQDISSGARSSICWANFLRCMAESPITPRCPLSHKSSHCPLVITPQATLTISKYLRPRWYRCLRHGSTQRRVSWSVKLNKLVKTAVLRF